MLFDSLSGRLSSILVITLSLLATGCGGGGGGGGGGGSTADFSGTWEGQGTQSSDCGDDGTGSATIEISQDGSSVTVTDSLSGETFSGTIDGDTVTADSAFSFSEDGGTTTVTSWSATLDSSGEEFSGSSSFEFSDPSGFTCSGTVDFSATRTSGGGGGGDGGGGDGDVTISRVPNLAMGDLLIRDHVETSEGIYFSAENADLDEHHVGHIASNQRQWTDYRSYEGDVRSIWAEHDDPGVAFDIQPLVLAENAMDEVSLYEARSELWNENDDTQWGSMWSVAQAGKDSNPQINAASLSDQEYRVIQSGGSVGSLERIEGFNLASDRGARDLELVASRDYIFAYGYYTTSAGEVVGVVSNLTTDEAWEFDTGRVYHVLPDSYDPEPNALWMRSGDSVYHFDGNSWRERFQIPDFFNGAPTSEVLASATDMAQDSVSLFFNGGLRIRKLDGTFCNYLQGYDDTTTQEGLLLQNAFMTSGVIHAAPQTLYAVLSEPEGEQIVALSRRTITSENCE